jgi:type II secretory pathway pseudopilin PulG
MIPLWAISAIGAGALAFASAWQVQEWRAEAREADRLRAVAEQARRNERTIAKAAEVVVQKQEVTRVVFETITREVDKIVDRPVYLRSCVDPDGLRVIARAVATTTDTSASSTTVPSSDTANRGFWRGNATVGGANSPKLQVVPDTAAGAGGSLAE